MLNLYILWTLKVSYLKLHVVGTIIRRKYCNTIDAGVGVYRVNYTYVHMCKHMSTCEYMYVYIMYVRVYTYVYGCELTVGMCI